MDAVRLLVTAEDFDPGREIERLSSGEGQSGAVATFIGLVRGAADGVSAMTLEHYPGMTEKQIGTLIEEARARWALERVTVIHRVGRLLPGERIVFVGVAGRHRAESFAACEFLIDWLKTRAPFWKMEETESGERWVEAREEDDKRADRWNRTPP
jgi:molybdopterin synthase catalytic subunit